MKVPSEMSELYKKHLREGIITISDDGVMTRDIVATLKTPEGATIAKRVIEDLKDHLKNADR